MPKCINAFFSVGHNKIFNEGDEISEQEYHALPNGYKDNFDTEPQADVEVVVTEKIAEFNPELEQAGVKVGDTVTFTDAEPKAE